MFTDSFGSYACTGLDHGIECESEGFTFCAYLEHDDAATLEDNDPCTFEGLISDWTSRDKRAGEMILCRDRGQRRYFDFAECVRRAKADGWNMTPPATGTKGQIAHAVAMHTFNAARAWFNDEWHYVGVVIAVYRNGILLDDHAASLWGIECNYPGSDNSWLVECANDLLPEALEAARRVMETLNA